MKIPSVISKIKNFLVSPLPIAGLEISNTSLKYLLIKNNSIVQASLRLPPGIIERGLIKDRKNFVAALKNIHQQVAPLTKPLNVVLVLPSNLVFAQAFSVPIVDKENMEESIGLNLQMISPNKIEDSYYDWQEIKENKDLGHLDVLGAFTASGPVNDYEAAFKEANFTVVSVEFPGLSLARLIRERWGGIETEQNYVLVYINGEGLLLLILKNGNLFFNHFTPWNEVSSIRSSGDKGVPEIKKISFEEVREFITQEVQRVLNFYQGRFGKALQEAILISPVFNYEIVKIVSEKMGLKIRNLTIAELPDLQPGWFPALGAALRGLVSRAKDTFISLTQSNAMTEYYEERLLSFMGLWRNIILGTLIFIFFSYILVDTSFVKQERHLEARASVEFAISDLETGKAVQGKIDNFNKLLSWIENVSEQETVWSSFIEKMDTLAGTEITLEHVFADKVNKVVQVSGTAVSEQAAISYKNRLSEVPFITEVSLPLSNLKPDIDARVSFSLSFNVTAFES